MSDINDFISNLSIEKTHQNIYTKDEARFLYQSNYRNRILKELEIREVQNKVRNKILKKEDGGKVDILFYKSKVSDDLSINDMSNLLSDFSSSENEEIEINTEVENMKFSKKSTISGKSKYIDVEAEYSGDSVCEEESNGEEDLSSFVDNEEYSDMETFKLYYEEKKNEGEVVLRKLKDKFGKKKNKLIKNEFTDINIPSESSEDIGFSELDVEYEPLRAEKKTFSFLSEEEKKVDANSNLITFNNLDYVGKKFKKKEEQFKFKD